MIATSNDLKLNDTYFAITKDNKIPVLVTNQDNVFAYCTILAGTNVGEEISLRKEHTTFKKKSKAK